MTDSDNDLERLRAHHARLPKAEPSTQVDATIREAARLARPRRVRASALFATAACAALAAVLVPALLVDATREADQSAYQTRAEQTQRQQTEDEQRERVEPPPAMETIALQEAPRPAAAATRMAPAPPRTDADTIRTRLVAESEALWRSRILELHAAGQEDIARELLMDYRKRFERPDDFGIEQLKAEEIAARSRPEPIRGPQ